MSNRPKRPSGGCQVSTYVLNAASPHHERCIPVYAVSVFMQPISLTVPCDVIVGNNLGHHGSIALAEGLPHSGLTVLRASGAAVHSSTSPPWRASVDVLCVAVQTVALAHMAWGTWEQGSQGRDSVHLTYRATSWATLELDTSQMHSKHMLLPTRA